MTRSLCLVVCAAGPASQAGVLVRLAREAGWAVRVVVTPAALDLIDGEALAASAESPVRSAFRAPGASRSPVPDAVLPFVNSVLAGRLPFRRAVELLRAEGVTVLFETHPPGAGDTVAFPWERALAAVAAHRS